MALPLAGFPSLALIQSLSRNVPTKENPFLNTEQMGLFSKPDWPESQVQLWLQTSPSPPPEHHPGTDTNASPSRPVLALSGLGTPGHTHLFSVTQSPAGTGQFSEDKGNKALGGRAATGPEGK